MSRIDLEMTGADSIAAICDGNIGALSALMTLMEHPTTHFAGPFGVVLDLDTHEIYGSNIWILYKDICHENADQVFLTLRAMQLGTFSKDEIQEVLRSNASGRGGKKFLSDEIPLPEGAYDMKGNDILDFEKFQEYLDKQREVFKSQFDEEEKDLSE